MDVFSWSVPFLAEKVTSMLYNIIKKGGEDIALDENVDVKEIINKEGLSQKIQK